MKNLKLTVRETEQRTTINVSDVTFARDFVVIAALDLSAVPAIKELTHLPIIIDPTHSTGRVNLIGPMSLAAVAAGADGIIVEVHHNPEEALCDADQALTPAIFTDIMRRLRPLKTFMDTLPV